LKTQSRAGRNGVPIPPIDLNAQVTDHFAIGHVNTDGIMDICVATKVGLAVYLGQ
jgi:hypothetical protein